jgi:hypothetical protein
MQRGVTDVLATIKEEKGYKDGRFMAKLLAGCSVATVSFPFLYCI